MVRASLRPSAPATQAAFHHKEDARLIASMADHEPSRRAVAGRRLEAIFILRHVMNGFRA
jgi:hypothetical protein